jgi:hypothetical protein
MLPHWWASLRSCTVLSVGRRGRAFAAALTDSAAPDRLLPVGCVSLLAVRYGIRSKGAYQLDSMGNAFMGFETIDHTSWIAIPWQASTPATKNSFGAYHWVVFSWRLPATSLNFQLGSLKHPKRYKMTVLLHPFKSKVPTF